MSVLAKIHSYLGRTSYITKYGDKLKVLFIRHCDTTSAARKESNEKEEFRVLKVRPERDNPLQQGRQRRKVTSVEINDVEYEKDFDWTSIWVGPRSFDPYMVPIPIRQGYKTKGVSPGRYANVELLKIPNFLHLTPPAIQKHCAVLKQFCTEWPEELDSEEKMEKHFPITIIASDYCHSLSTICDPLSRIITLKVKMKYLDFDKHAKDKFLRLVGDRYNPANDEVTIVVENCPLKKQNYDYAMYILTALCFESWKIEDWEKLKEDEDMEEYVFSKRQTKRNMDAFYNYTGKEHPSYTKLDSLVSEYVTEVKESEMINSLKEEVLNMVGLPKFNA